MSRPRIYTDEERKERTKIAVRKASKKYYCTLKGRAYALRRGAINRAKKFNLEFALSQTWIEEQLRYGCAVTGRPFSFVTEETYGVQNNVHPWSPSIDRIDPKLGYTESNSRVVCCIFNFCKHHWTDDVVTEFATDYVNYIGVLN